MDGIVVIHQGSAYDETYEKGQIIDQRPVAGIEVIPGTKVFVTVSMGAEPPAKTMEDLVGLKAEEAKKFLDGLKLNLHIINREVTNPIQPQGYVVRTVPGEGDPLTPGQTITIYVSIGPEIVKEKMPNVVGKDIQEALSILAKKGFADVHQNPVDSNRPKGEVVNQSEEWLSKIDVTTSIILDVSTGVSELPTVPPTVPTEPDATEPEPTEPVETTGPDEGMSTLTRFFILPTRTESYFIGLTLDGVWVVENMEIAPGQTGVTIPLTGKGTMKCVLYIDGTPYETVMVEFDPDD
jgi:beta-lactam-binding protein with PASTA domain